MTLPRPIAVRLHDTRRHFASLKRLVEQTTESDFVAASSGDVEELTKLVYPLERAFEILDNYVLELAEHGLHAAGIASESSGTPRLRQLESEGVISDARRERLTRIHEVRNRMQHEYPDVRAKAVYGAAVAILVELPGFFRDYAAWMRKLGFRREDWPSRNRG